MRKTEEAEKRIFCGTIIFLKQNDGSKSEGIFPYIYVNKDECLKVFKVDDNPFSNDALIPFDGKYVEIVCHADKSNTLLIEEIKEIKNKTNEDSGEIND